MLIQEIKDKVNKICENKGISKTGRTFKEIDFIFGELRKLALEIGFDDNLGKELVNTKVDVLMIIGAMLMIPENMSEYEIYDYLEECDNPFFIDEIAYNTYLKNPLFPYLDSFIYSPNPAQARFGWDIATFKVMKNNILDLNIDSLLEYLEKRMLSFDKLAQYSMNRFLCELGLYVDEYMEKAIETGKRIGPLSSKKASIGFSTYAPDYIIANRARQKF
ncbi:MAG: hypothetical protein LBV58_03230 [Acholeplasmatales bacterium]|jgi:3-methyladenine DNA glycosylase AlkD|nr:hypothetical protein [Acholeplasmatales bacterium]